MDFVGLVLQLILDTGASWIRMFIALGLSVLISVAVGIYAATHSRAEKVILPVVDVLQTLPILAFFPFAIYIFVAVLPGYIGINAAVIFLIITSMVWNIILGVYESVKTIPREFIEVSMLYRFNRWARLRRIYMPACLPRIIEQSILSWSIGLFYLVTSEIFSVGLSQEPYQVTYGIGVAFTTLPAQGAAAYLTGIAVFIAFVVATRFLFFRPLENYSVKYMKQQADTPRTGYDGLILNWISRRIPKTPAIFTAAAGSPGHGSVHAKAKRYAVHVHGEGRSYKRLYQAGAFAAMLVILYVIFSNPTWFGYEAEVFPALAFSFARVWLAFAVMVVVGVPLCIYLIFLTKQSSKYMLLFQIAASIPATILLPAIALGLKSYGGSAEMVAFVIFLLSGVWYIIFSIMASTRTLSPSIFEVQKIFGVKGWNAWKNIYVKAIIPGLITGAMTAIAAEWNASIVAEYFTSSTVTSAVGTGIGKLLDLSLSPGGQGLGLMAVALLNLVVMILLINTFVWKRYYRNISKIYGG